MDYRRARLLRVLGMGNGGSQLEIVLLSQSLRVKQWLNESIEAGTDRQIASLESSSHRIRDILHDDALEFVQQVVEKLSIWARVGQLDQLIVFAEPPMMQLLRLEFSPLLSDRLIFTREIRIRHIPETMLFDTISKIIDEQN